KDQNQRQIAKQIQKNEKVLEGIKHSLDVTKKTTDAELKTIQEQKEKQISNINDRFQSDYSARLDQQQEKLSELEHESSIELDRIRRAQKRTIHDIQNENRASENETISQGQDKLELTKNEFNRRYNNKQDQYYRALSNQDQNYKKRLTGLEEKYQERLSDREAQTTQKLALLEKVE